MFASHRFPRSMILIAVACGLWVAAGMFGAFVSGCSGGGSGGGDNKEGADIDAGPTSPYLLYSAFDGSDYEIYLLNPRGTSSDASGKPTPEILQLTNNNTADFAPAGAHAILAWQCDDGAGSELCVMNVKDKTFKQATKIAGGGAMGRTLGFATPHLAPDGSIIIDQAYTDGLEQEQRKSLGILNYNVKGDKLLMTSVAEQLGSSSEFSNFWESFASLDDISSSGGTIVTLKEQRPGEDYSTTPSSLFFMSSSGDMKKLPEGLYSSFSRSYKGWRFAWNANDGALYRINMTTGSVEAVASDIKVAGLWTPSGMAPNVFESSADNELKLSVVDVDANKLKPLTSLSANVAYGSWVASRDQTKLLVVSSTSEGQEKGTMKVALLSIDLTNGAQTEVASEVISNASYSSNRFSFIAGNDDFSLVVYRGYKPGSNDVTSTLADTVNKTQTELDGNPNVGWFSADNKAFVYAVYSTDSFVYDIAAKKSTPLPMPIFSSFYSSSPVYIVWGSAFESPAVHGQYALLRKQQCPVGACEFYDNRATTTCAIYDISAGNTIDIPGNGRDLVRPVWVELTDGQYAAWKAAAADANLIASAKPAADSGGPALKWIPPFSGSGSLDWVPPFVYSRQAGATFTIQMAAGGKTATECGIDQSLNPNPNCYFWRTTLDDDGSEWLWPSRAEWGLFLPKVLQQMAADMSAAEKAAFLSSDQVLTFSVSDGTSTAQQSMLLKAEVPTISVWEKDGEFAEDTTQKKGTLQCRVGGPCAVRVNTWSNRGLTYDAVKIVDDGGFSPAPSVTTTSQNGWSISFPTDAPVSGKVVAFQLPGFDSTKFELTVKVLKAYTVQVKDKDGNDLTANNAREGGITCGQYDQHCIVDVVVDASAGDDLVFTNIPLTPEQGNIVISYSHNEEAAAFKGWKLTPSTSTVGTGKIMFQVGPRGDSSCTNCFQFTLTVNVLAREMEITGVQGGPEVTDGAITKVCYLKNCSVKVSVVSKNFNVGSLNLSVYIITGARGSVKVGETKQVSPGTFEVTFVGDGSYTFGFALSDGVARLEQRLMVTLGKGISFPQ